MDRLKDRVALITGGASGMGEASVRLFIAEGARVLLADTGPLSTLANIRGIRLAKLHSDIA